MFVLFSHSHIRVGCQKVLHPHQSFLPDLMEANCLYRRRPYLNALPALVRRE